jgi:hypothetical protein
MFVCAFIIALQQMVPLINFCNLIILKFIKYDDFLKSTLICHVIALSRYTPALDGKLLVRIEATDGPLGRHSIPSSRLVKLSAEQARVQVLPYYFLQRLLMH